jgi:hypothetical protein
VHLRLCNVRLQRRPPEHRCNTGCILGYPPQQYIHWQSSCWEYVWIWILVPFSSGKLLSDWHCPDILTVPFVNHISCDQTRCRSSRRVSGRTPTEVFALATPKSTNACPKRCLQRSIFLPACSYAQFPEGPSYTTAVCPKYTPMGEFTNNVAHSNMFYGLRCVADELVRDDACRPSYPLRQIDDLCCSSQAAFLCIPQRSP